MVNKVRPRRKSKQKERDKEKEREKEKEKGKRKKRETIYPESEASTTLRKVTFAQLPKNPMLDASTEVAKGLNYILSVLK